MVVISHLGLCHAGIKCHALVSVDRTNAIMAVEVVPCFLDLFAGIASGLTVGKYKTMGTTIVDIVGVGVQPRIVIIGHRGRGSGCPAQAQGLVTQYVVIYDYGMLSGNTSHVVSSGIISENNIVSATTIKSRDVCISTRICCNP